MKRIFLLGALLAPLTVSASCGSAFCMVDTQWSMQGVNTSAGTRLDLRYEYIKQDQPQNGRDKIGVGEIRRDHDEVSTLNRNYVGTLDHSFNESWGINVAVPMVNRDHHHNMNNDDGTQTPESWNFTELGDVRVLGRYQFTPTESAEHTLAQWGLYFGAKLPTGSHTVANEEGVTAERTLQPGTGTTDALFGAFVRRALPLKDMSWFSQALVQLPLNTKDEYKPGKRLSVDTGLRHESSERLALLLQANLLFRGRDSGDQAEPEDSGGRSLWISPGVSYAITKNVQTYGFVQLPLYQYVNGVQLVATRSFVFGVSTRF